MSSLRKLFGSKTALVLLTATGALTLHAHAPHSLQLPSDFKVAHSGSGSVEAVVDAVVRSSRAISTVAVTLVDYKYSLHGLPKGSDEYRHELSEVHMRSARRLLRLCEANKGFYIKAGQFVAALGQAPKEYVSTLSSLQDKAVPCDYVAIREVLVSNFGQDLSEIFHSFGEQPIAAASIAQVHRATLKDHQEVAVKVQYPGLERQRKLDMMTMHVLSHCVTWLFPEYRFVSLVLEFSKAVSMELDFIQEARNSERTAKNISKDVITVPKVFWELTTKQVLTMQFCKGQRVDDVDFLRKMGIDPTKVAKALVEVFAEMILVHGFVHGDPHPGNILVSPTDRGGFTIVLLDHGIYKQLDDEFRRNYCQLWKALILQDSEKIQQLGEQFGVGEYSRYFPVIFTGRTVDSKSALGKGMTVKERKELKKELKTLRMEDISSFLESLSPDFLMILRVDGLLRSINRKLGAPQRVRLLTYAKFALYGLSTRPNRDHESQTGVSVLFSTLNRSIAYFRLRLVLEVLELLSWIKRLRQSSILWLKYFFASIQHSL
ncbi:aarF domain-containing protein kinase 1 isoform X2 [Punica granatum]|uniref:AarF domain-containing protein kinase 1 isoform X2 n=1 Tax=Punica granatum TaxID=22663 RepID=A0A6P8DEB4_PUNGR|nr:aarF domain-containing protein kinase 1 isoform X2 [Punica granatum]